MPNAEFGVIFLNKSGEGSAFAWSDDWPSIRASLFEPISYMSNLAGLCLLNKLFIVAEPDWCLM